MALLFSPGHMSKSCLWLGMDIGKGYFSDSIMRKPETEHTVNSISACFSLIYAKNQESRLGKKGDST